MKRRLLIVCVPVVAVLAVLTVFFFRSFNYQHSGNCRPFDVVNIRIGNNEFAVPPALKPEIGGYDRDLVLRQDANVLPVEGRLPFCPRPPMTRIDANYLRVEYPVLKSRKPSYLKITNLAFYDPKNTRLSRRVGDPIKVHRYCDSKSPTVIAGSLVDFCMIRYIPYRGLDIILFTDHAGINSFSDDSNFRYIYYFLDNMQTGTK